MSKRKGMSLEEKRAKVLSIFHERKQVFQLKDVEAMASKEKGVVLQSVKDVLKSLVDDDLVDTDKIGTSTYFWAFPSKALIQLETRLANLEKMFEEANANHLHTQNTLAEKQKTVNPSASATPEMLGMLSEYEEQKRSLEQELTNLKANDPKVIEQLQKDLGEIKEATNRWTDNIFALRLWIRQRSGMTEADIEKAFEIPAGLDYVE